MLVNIFCFESNVWAIIIVVSCRQHTLHYSGRQFRMNFISTVAQWDKFFVFLVFIRFSLILKWHCLWWGVLKALNKVSLDKCDLKELLVLSYPRSFFFVELVWMLFDWWSCSKYYCIRNSKTRPCVKLFLLLTRFYSLPKTMAVLIYFYFWKFGSWGLFLQWWFFLSVSCIQALMIQDFLVAFFCFLWINALEI